MKKVLMALGVSIAVSVLVVTGWFMFFGFSSFPELGGELLSLSERSEYWLGLGIFLALFFVLFALPLAFMIVKDSD